MKLVALALVAWSLTGGAAVESADSAADRVARALEGSGGDIPAQARILSGLAWTDPGVPDAVRVEARTKLVQYGELGIPAIREVLRTSVAASADATAALLEARKVVPSGIPVEFLPALDEALWFGSEEAKRLVIPYLASSSTLLNVLPMIDAAEEYPGLKPMVVHAVGVSGNPRGRFWLDGLLHGSDPELRSGAAEALTKLGNEGFGVLRAALEDSSAAVRRAAMEALLPLSSPAELPDLNRFLETYGSADPELAAAVRTRISELELLRHSGAARPPS